MSDRDFASTGSTERPDGGEQRPGNGERAERAARYSDLFGSGHEHASDCAYCPICATIAVVRETRPEVLDHLAAAARELVLAAGILVEEAGEILDRASAQDRASGDKIRHIKIT